MRAFRWTLADGMQSLGILTGGSYSYAYGISADGSVVSGVSGTPSGDRAFRWTAGEGMHSLGVLAGAQRSFARAISGDGLVIGGHSDSLAFIWTERLGMVQLGELLTSQGVVLSGWTLREPLGISYDGTALTGFGVFNGQNRAWVVLGLSTAPPPPCGDLSGDGLVNFVDITSILSTWGTSSTFGDADENGIVDFADITVVLASWGAVCR